MNHSDPSSPLPGRGRIAAAVASVAVIAAALTAVAPPALAAEHASTPATAPAGAPTLDVGPDGDPEYDDGRYIVTLREEAVATYGGGVGSFAGAVLGGLIAGEIISLTSMVNPGYAYVMLFAAMTLVLLVRPHGLLGTRGRE